MPVQRDRQSEPDQAAPEDDDVGALHFSYLAVHRCNASRRTTLDRGLRTGDFARTEH